MKRVWLIFDILIVVINDDDRSTVPFDREGALEVAGRYGNVRDVGEDCRWENTS